MSNSIRGLLGVVFCLVGATSLISGHKAQAEPLSIVRVDEDSGLAFEGDLPEDVVQRIVGLAQQVHNMNRFYRRGANALEELIFSERLAYCQNRFARDNRMLLECMGIQMLHDKQDLLIGAPFPDMRDLRSSMYGRVMVDVPDINYSVDVVIMGEAAQVNRAQVASFLAHSVGVHVESVDSRSPRSLVRLQTRFASLIPAGAMSTASQFIPPIPDICPYMLCADLDGCPCTSYLWDALPHLGIDLDEIAQAQDTGHLAESTRRLAELIDVN